MTPARKAALQWFYDRGEVGWFKLSENPPSYAMMVRMIRDGHLEKRNNGDLRLITYTLTDAGRRALNGDKP